METLITVAICLLLGWFCIVVPVRNHMRESNREAKELLDRLEGGKKAAEEMEQQRKRIDEIVKGFENNSPHVIAMNVRWKRGELGEDECREFKKAFEIYSWNQVYKKVQEESDERLRKRIDRELKDRSIGQRNRSDRSLSKDDDHDYSWTGFSSSESSDSSGSGGGGSDNRSSDD